MNTLDTILHQRFNEDIPVDSQWQGMEQLTRMAARGSCRQFSDKPVDTDLLRALCAVALSSPTKSDLQQRDIVIVESDDTREKIHSFLGSQTWVASAPSLLIFCGNNRRQRLLHQLRDREFANDHLDAFFNAAVDAGIALSAFVTAAEFAGLGTCPVSAVRNHPHEISALLNLPEHVFPVAGLALGYPQPENPDISLRLPTCVTVHTDTYCEDGLEQEIARYDEHRRNVQPYATRRPIAGGDENQPYTWSEDKARQYSLPERNAFGEFIRSKGFDLK